MTLYPFFKKGTQFDFSLIELKIITNQKNYSYVNEIK